MAMYYGDYPDVFTADSLRMLVRNVFYSGFGVRTKAVLEPMDRYELMAAREVFEYLLEWRLPDLGELRSAGPARDYAEEQRRKWRPSKADAAQNVPK